MATAVTKMDDDHHPYNNNKMKSSSSVASDAAFLETLDASSSSTSAHPEAPSAVLELHRSNLLRLQAQELVQECTHGSGTGADNNHAFHWIPISTEYIQHVQDLILQSWKQEISASTLESMPFEKLSDKPAIIKTAKTAGFSSSLSVQATGCTASCLHHPTGSISSDESFLGLTNVSGNANVLPTLDIVVKIPNDVWEPKDYLRNRYFDKRNQIVWHVAQFLSQKRFRSTVGKVYWRYLHADKRKPVLLLIPPTQQDKEENMQHQTKQNKKEKKQQTTESSLALRCTKKLRFRVQVLFGMESIEWIPPLRLLPNRSNLVGRDNNNSQFTPYYNQSLVEEASHEFLKPLFLHDHHHHQLDYSKTMKDALVLAKVWSLQRGLLRGHDSFQTEHLALLMTYLFRTKLANPRMTPLQVLAAFFKLVAQTNWLGENDYNERNTNDKKTDTANLIRKAPSEAYQGSSKAAAMKRTVLVMPQEGKTEQQTMAACPLAKLYEQQTRESPVTPHDPPTLVELYQQTSQQQQQQHSTGPVFLDPTMTCNFLARVSPSFIRTAQREAANSLECIHSARVCDRPFPYLFMARARFWSRHDAYLRVPLSKAQFGKGSLWGSDRKDVGDYESIARGIVCVLRRALGDRINDIGILTTGNGHVEALSETADAVRDSDEVPSFEIGRKNSPASSSSVAVSPTGCEYLVIGITLNSDACFRVVDRGPPADDEAATEAFQRLWGSRTQLRRFKDGAIVYAVVWEATLEGDENSSDSSYIRFENDDKLQGGIVERIIRHILRLHFLKDSTDNSSLQFSLRDMLSLVDGVLQRGESNDVADFNQLTAHRMVTTAFNSLSDFLRQHSAATVSVPGSSELTSRLGLPLAIDAVEPLSPALRYAELFPPLPHPWVGSSMGARDKKTSGAILSDPIEIQIRFGASSKWPTDMKAIGAAKAAMLVRLVGGIESMRNRGLTGSNDFYGHSCVTPTHADIGFKGYVFRIRVRADPELRLLQSLSKPNSEALSLLHILTRRHVVASMHHSMIQAVYSRCPSSSAVTRMAKRWLSSHLLSGHIPFEAIELLVASAYTNKASPLVAPGTVVAGFLRFLEVLSTHDWSREPLIVDPQGSLSPDDLNEISREFERIRGPNFQNGPPMYIISPSDNAASDSANGRRWVPSFTMASPENVVFSRALKLACRTHSFFRKSLVDFQLDSWPSAFLETTQSFLSYSALLRTDPEFVVDPSTSSTGGELAVQTGKNGAPESVFTRGMRNRWRGPKALQRKLYRNTTENNDAKVLLEWNPVDSVVQGLRNRLGPVILVFYNELCPDVIALLWRPLFTPRAFSAMGSEYALPVTADGWQRDTLVTLNVGDILREISQFTKDVVVDTKVFDAGPPIISKKRKLAARSDSDSSCSDSSSVEDGGSDEQRDGELCSGLDSDAE